MAATSTTVNTQATATPWHAGMAGFLKGEGDTWLFVLRTTVAFFLTGWLAMRLQLPQPGTAMMTTVIVMHRQSGMVLAKAFYRVLGTLVGAAAALLIVGLFPQQREPFLVLMALWIAGCTAGATLHRNFKSYAFVLAGYTAAIIALPVISTHPGQIFDSAVARISEVLLGLLVTAVISDTIFPVRLRDTLRAAVSSQYGSFLDFTRGALLGETARGQMEQAHLRVVRDAVTLEDLRSSVIFEDPEARARSAHLQRFNQRFMAASTSFQSLHHLINRLLRQPDPAVGRALQTLYQPLGAALQAGDPQQPEQLAAQIHAVRRGLPAHAAQLRTVLADAARIEDFAVGAELLRRFVKELEQYVLARGQLTLQVAPTQEDARAHFVRGNDYLGAAVAFIRTAITMLLLGALWAASGWAMAVNVMLLATIFSGLFATVPSAARMTGKVAWGYLVGVLAAYVCDYAVLTRMEGYTLLVAGLLPFFLIGPYLVSRPKLTVFGLGYTLGLVNMLAISGVHSFDPLRFFNEGTSHMFAMGAAVLSFALMPPLVGTAWLRRRQMAGLRAQVRLAAQAPLRGLQQRFESSNSDLLHQIVMHTAPGSSESSEQLAWALAVNETGRALIHLRHDVAHEPAFTLLHQRVDAVVQALSAFFTLPSVDGWQRADRALEAAVALAREQAGERGVAARVLLHLRLVRLAMVDDRSVMAAYITASEPTKESPVHAH
ncbi:MULTISPECIES: FUSC family protein [Stenotrophomonas]|uniref:FUSC family protein n=1 Tax=Stenotrophomonas TaxID=40323 RepID=UPI0009E8FF12|nr:MULTISPECIES: FUSC family protein [Stenotrophomonas]